MVIGKLSKGLVLPTCIALAVLAGCSKTDKVKVEVHKPSPLPKLAQIQTLTPVFRASVPADEKHDPLRLQLDIDDNAIYAVSRNGQVFAYGSNGKTIWKTKLGKREKNLTSGASAGEGIVVVGSHSGVLYGLDAASGILKWQRQLSGSILAPSLIHQGRVVTFTNDGAVYGTDVESGKAVWSFNTAANQLSVRGTAAPILADNNTVVIAGSNGYVYGLTVSSGVPKWQRRTAVSDGRSEVQRLIDIDGDPAVYEGKLFTTSYQGQLTAVDLASQRVLWSQDTSSLRGPAVDQERAYVATTEGKLQAFDLLGGEPVWQQDALAYRQLSNPVVLGQYLIVGDLDGYLHLIDPASGNLLGRVRNKGEIRFIRVVNNRLYVASRTGNLSVWQVN